MTALPDAFDESQYDGVQYIFRGNGELNINVAKEDADFHVVVFSYFTYQFNEQMEWNLMDEGPGIYLIQLHGESHWDYLDEVKA